MAQDDMTPSIQSSPPRLIDPNAPPAAQAGRRNTRAPSRFSEEIEVKKEPKPEGGGGRKKKMPAATPKRVKNTRISRPFIIGNEAWELDDSLRKPDTPPDHTKGWRVYVKGTENGPNITAWLKKVQFKIFHTYPNPVRVVEEPPFEVQETGWGGFLIDVKLFFTPEAGAKPETRTHFLQLEPYGDEQQRARQAAEKRVRSEFLEIIEFNEPPEALYNVLTGDEQWVPQTTNGASGSGGGSRRGGKGGAVGAGASRGKGKGKGRGGAEIVVGPTVPAGEATVELPETSADRENPFTREHERRYTAMIEAKLSELEGIHKAEKSKHDEVLERLESLKKRQDEASNAATAAGAA